MDMDQLCITVVCKRAGGKEKEGEMGGVVFSYLCNILFFLKKPRDLKLTIFDIILYMLFVI